MSQIRSTSAKLDLAIQTKAVEDEEKRRKIEKEENKKREAQRLAEERALHPEMTPEDEAEEAHMRGAVEEMRKNPTTANMVKVLTANAGNLPIYLRY